MRTSYLLSVVCTLGLLATPAVAAGTATQTPQGSSAATSGAGAPKSTSSGAATKKVSTTHAVRMAHAGKGNASSHASSQDNMADQLNSQSLQAAQQGRPYSVSR
jgi:hypothetical protein